MRSFLFQVGVGVWRSASMALIAVWICTCSSLVIADEEYSEFLPPHHVSRRDTSSTLRGAELRIATILSPPYMNITTDSYGQQHPTGFIPDLLFKLSRRLGFSHKFIFVDKYGFYDNTTQQWTGMIGELVKHDRDPTQGAHMAAAAITITADREKVVNFVKPFQNLGFSVVIKRPEVPGADRENSSPFTFSIFQPFEPVLWALIILSVIVVGLFLWLMNMYNPYEWAGRYGLGLADKQQSEYFNLAGSMWFVFTTLQWQGFEKAPRSLASKFLGCIWFAFVSIVLVTYTAGIVNHLFWASMVHRNPSNRAPFVDLAHLINSKEYKYGVIRNGQTHRYLRDVAPGEEFDAIRRYLKSAEGEAQLVNSVDEGIAKVRKEKYAFIMESMMAKHEMNRRPCDLITVGEQFGTRAYGLALPINSTILNDLNIAILELVEEGEIEELERRWWVDRNECWNVTVSDRLAADAQASALSVNRPTRVDLKTFWGPLVMVIAGLVLSLAVAFAEMMYYRQWGRYKSSNQPQGQQLKMDPDEGNI